VQVIVAGFGNVLRGDDGFGVAVAERLQAAPVPPGVRVMEVGIGGIHLVQELLDGVDALVVVDAVDLGRAPGTVVVVEPDVTDPALLDLTQRRDLLADMHYATPQRAFILAAGLRVLPATTLLVGCQTTDAGSYEQGLSAEVAGSVDAAAAEVRRIVTELGVAWA
jgi:hydrogenase maturation protease